MPSARFLKPFPFDDCGTDTRRYVQGNLSQMMAFYWRVRSFSISGSYTNYLHDDLMYPQNNSFNGSVTSPAVDEIELVCNPSRSIGYEVNIVSSGSGINSAYLYIAFQGSDFSSTSNPNQTVKLYGDFIFETDQDETSGVGVAVGGNLSPFIIDGFQVYESGSPVNYVGSPISNFTCSIQANTYWSYGGKYNTSTGEEIVA